MEYLLEQLGDERFQQLSQALILAEYPNAISLPIGQPDGGRDSFVRDGSTVDVVFQMKFVKNPSTREARDEILHVASTEAAKVRRLIGEGLRRYVLITNVGGTSHPGVGSIDTLNALLTAELGVESTCWWRDDIMRRLDNNREIRWVYPEILKATDILQTLLRMGSADADARRKNAIQTYLAGQYRDDEQLKFRQIDLQAKIARMFVDVPIRLLLGKKLNHQMWLAKSGFTLDKARMLNVQPFDELSYPDRHFGAMKVLSDPDIMDKLPRIVLEGAPGQGKSTVTQFLCQVHRMRLLGKAELSSVKPAFVPRSAAIPFRVDLREYATWLSGKEPFTGQFRALEPGVSKNLESFVSSQVQHITGVTFAVEDFLAVISDSRALVVLDGFDEVADIQLRGRIIDEVSGAATRIAEVATKLNVLVTSRPAAFVNSRGFPDDEWQHFELMALSQPLIEEYADRWTEYRDIDQASRARILAVLGEKLGSPHVKDLARNPMQLAILLTLISVRGVSLPDKRTALYDGYIDIFLNREAEKSDVVRDHRNLISKVHEYIAWKLHGGAETEKGAGRITEEELRGEIRRYLEEREFDGALADRIMPGMAERVGVLVSRVQGTYEFEVQPLREYFAAKFLYDTAPYDPVGSPRRGGIPERLSALLKNSYWTNVARFFAGCFSSGELGSLVDGLEDIHEVPKFQDTVYAPQVALTLLSDYVFSEVPKVARRAAEFALSGERLVRLTAPTAAYYARNIIRMPDGTARNVLVDRCQEILLSDVPMEAKGAAALALAGATSRSELLSWWEAHGTGIGTAEHWFGVAGHLGILSSISADDQERLIERFGDVALRRLCTVSDVLSHDTDARWAKLVRWAGEEAEYAFPSPNASSAMNGLSLIGVVLSQFAGHPLDRNPGEARTADYLSSLYGVGRGASPSEVFSDPVAARLIPSDVGQAISDVLDARVRHLRSGGAKEWHALFAALDRWWGDTWSVKSAISSLGIRTKAAPNTIPSMTLAIEAKRFSNDVVWWGNKLTELPKWPQIEQDVLLSLLGRVAHDRVLAAHQAAIETTLDARDERSWQRIASSVARSRWQSRRRTDNVRASGQTYRFITLLAFRDAPKQTSVATIEALKNYQGADWWIWSAAASAALENLAIHPVSATALDVIARANRVGAEGYSQRDRSKISRDAALVISKAASSYPLNLVGQAERSLQAFKNRGVLPVAKIAAEDRWEFGEDGS